MKLKNFPLCNGKAHISKSGKGKYRVYVIICNNCTVATAWYPTSLQAKNAWNTRV